MARGLRFLRTSPWGVAATVLVLYVTWIGVAHLDLHRRMTDFAFIGREFVTKATDSPAINADRRWATSRNGYDGQFFLDIARDPGRADAYMDNPSYRYGRIVYPLLARTLALGRQDAIPFMLVAINVLAVALGTFALAVVLRRHGRSPWYALVFGLYPGVLVAVERDLSEALAYALVACAVALFDRSRPRDLIASSLLFAIAMLTREPTAIFAFVCAGLLIARDRSLRRGFPFAAAVVLPYLLYRSIYLDARFGHAGVPSRVLPTPVPFGGIAHYYPWDSSAFRQVYSIVLPGALCLVLAIWALVRRRWDVGLWALAANALVYVVLSPQAVFEDIYGSSRITTGVVVAFVLAIPAVTDIRPSFRWWSLLFVVAWMAPWWTLYEAGWFPYGRQLGPSPKSDLSVSIQTPLAAAAPEQEVDFTVWATNSSPDHGYADVVLTIKLPPGLRLIGPPYYERGSGCRGDTTLTCDLDDLSPNMGTPVRFGVRLTEVANQTVTVLLSAKGLSTPRRTSFTVLQR